VDAIKRLLNALRTAMNQITEQGQELDDMDEDADDDEEGDGEDYDAYDAYDDNYGVTNHPGNGVKQITRLQQFVFPSLALCYK
jgi:hypothetical protein